MTDGVADWLLEYAVAHVVLSLVIVPVACFALRLRAITPDRRATVLLLAYALVVVVPAMPLQAHIAGQMTFATSNATAIVAPPPANAGITRPPPALGEANDRITLPPRLAALILATWLAGMALALARLLRAHAGVRRMVAASRRSHALEDAYRQVIPAGVELLISPAFGPAAIGIVRRAIILPHAMALALPADALRAVMLHEATHHRRKDVPVLLVQRLVEAVLWWNPMVRLLGTEIDAAREVACDIGAARAYGTSSDYAEALLDAITHLVPATPHATARALCAAASLSTLDRRIDAIIEAPCSTRWAAKATQMALGGALVLLGAAAAVAAPKVVVAHANVAPASPVGMRASLAMPATQTEQDALLAAQDRYSQSLHESHERYSQALQHLVASYTREVTALAEQPPDDGKEARLNHLDQRYRRLFSDTESRFRDATAQAETTWMQARNTHETP